MYEMRHVESKQLSCINDKITQVTSRFLSISLSGLNRYLSLLLSMINNRPKPQLVIRLLSHNLRKNIINKQAVWHMLPKYVMVNVLQPMNISWSRAVDWIWPAWAKRHFRIESNDASYLKHMEQLHNVRTKIRYS